MDLEKQRWPEIIVAPIQERVEKCDILDGAFCNGTRYSALGDDMPLTKRTMGWYQMLK